MLSNDQKRFIWFEDQELNCIPNHNEDEEGFDRLHHFLYYKNLLPAISSFSESIRKGSSTVTDMVYYRSDDIGQKVGDTWVVNLM